MNDVLEIRLALHLVPFASYVYGADSLTRTDDLPLTRRRLYQLSYIGVERVIGIEPM